jgi:hypothetical protein
VALLQEVLDQETALGFGASVKALILRSARCARLEGCRPV